MKSLVEAARDGRLGEREAASLARHLGTCSECRELERTLDEVRTLLQKPVGPGPTPLEHQRGRLALLRAAAVPPAVPPGRSLELRRPPVRVSAWLVLAAALLGVGAVGVRSRATPHAIPLALHLPAPTRPSVEVAARTVTTVHGSPEARFERRTEQQLERVTLSEGTLDLTVRKLEASERFLVATSDAEVEVRGTAFEVEAHGGHIARVGVSEGKVEVRYRHSVAFVAAGESWRPPSDEASAADPTSAVEAPRMPVRAPAHAERIAVGTAPPSSIQERARQAASKDFGDAVDSLGRGDYAAARARLDAFRAAHPNDARADLAAFLTIVSLAGGGRHADARAAARRYLELYPEGDRRLEAQRLADGR
jgi:TolA-binding protein